MNAVFPAGKRVLLGMKEAAARMGVSRRTLERLIARGEFPRPIAVFRRSDNSVNSIYGEYVDRQRRERDLAGFGGRRGPRGSLPLP